MKKLLYGIATLVCAVFMAACGNSNTPSATIEAYLDDAISGNYAAMVDRIHFKEEVTPEKKQELEAVLQAKLKDAEEKGEQMTDYTIIGEEISEDGQTAVVTCTITRKDGKDSDSKMNLINVDGKWYLDATNK